MNTNEQPLSGPPSFGPPGRLTPHLAALADIPAIAAQYLPTEAESFIAPGEDADPIGDNAHSPVKGIVHRHPDRVLFKPVHVCAAYCRFCFRREMVGPGGDVLNEEETGRALAYIRNTPQIWEVILTGGDPLILSARRLSEMLDRLEEIDHVKILRVHTRLPLQEPARVNAEMIAALRRTKPLYISLHVNHAAELTADVRKAIARLLDAGAPLLAQTVLLKGVNDNADALENLFRTLVGIKVKPYYLHHCDMAPGTSHFRTTIEEGQTLMRELRARGISGLCLPEYVLDLPGGAGKVPVGPAYPIATTEDI